MLRSGKKKRSKVKRKNALEISLPLSTFALIPNTSGISVKYLKIAGLQLNLRMFQITSKTKIKLSVPYKKSVRHGYRQIQI